MSLPHQVSSNSDVVPVQSSPLQPGSSSQRDSALMYRASQVEEQNAMNKSLSGGKKGNYKHKGGSDTMVVPTFNTPGPEVGPVGANQNSQQSNAVMSQSGANSSCDSCIGNNSNTPHCQGPACNPNAGQLGGGCSSCSVGNNGPIDSNTSWGCMSGGKRKYVKSRKMKKSKKMKKSRKMKKTKKMKKSRKMKKTKKMKKSRKAKRS